MTVICDFETQAKGEAHRLAYCSVMLSAIAIDVSACAIVRM